METILIWGFEISARAAVVSIALYILVCLLAIILIPMALTPDAPKDSDIDKTTKYADLRAKVRQTVIQVLGGVTVLAAFLVTIQQIRQNEDSFKQAKADLFTKNVAALMDDSAKLNSHVQALYMLAHVARSDRTYHRAVFDVISSYIVQRSPEACKDGEYKQRGYLKDQRIQVAMKVLGERNPDHDPTGKQLNIEHGCLADVDLRDEWGVVHGLKGVRLSGAIMLRVDLKRVEMPGAELMGIEAGDWHNPGWTVSDGRGLHLGVDGDPRTSTVDGDGRRRLVAHFIDANLVDVNFSGAGLEGADFSGANLKDAVFKDANISRVSFKGALNLTAGQLEEACVGKMGLPKAELELEQPYLWRDLRDKVGSIRPCPTGK